MRWRNSMQQYIHEHLPLFIFVSVLFLVGVVFGALLVNGLSLEQSEEINFYLGSFFHTVDQGGAAEGSSLFKQTFTLHLKWMFLVWVLGLSVVGMPFILVLDFLKGVIIGFTVGYFVAKMSWKGMLFALVSVVPQNLFFIPSILILSVAGIAFSLHLVRTRLLQTTKGNVSHMLVRFSLVGAGLVVVVSIASLFEAYMSPVFMEWVIPVLTEKS